MSRYTLAFSGKSLRLVSIFSMLALLFAVSAPWTGEVSANECELPMIYIDGLGCVDPRCPAGCIVGIICDKIPKTDCKGLLP